MAGEENQTGIPQPLAKSNVEKPLSLEGMLNTDAVKKRFNEILGKNGPGFISSIVSVTSGSTQLKDVSRTNPRSIIAAAVVAATLELPINNNLGFAYIVPYKGVAQFQMGYKGFIQLAVRTGQYETIHASEVYEDELQEWNPLTGEFKTTPTNTWRHRDDNRREKIVGYVAFFRLTNGFWKYLYMSKEKVAAHGKRYSQSYSSEKSRWKQDFDAMGLKTVMKLLLSKYGLLSVQMRLALQSDQAIVHEKALEKGESGFDFTYEDNPGEEKGNAALPTGANGPVTFPKADQDGKPEAKGEGNG